LTALLYAWFRGHAANPWSQITYSMFPWVMIFGLRGDLLQTSTLALFLYLPIALAYYLSPGGHLASEVIASPRLSAGRDRPLQATRH
jgi:hypothetical protein